jgi:tRNA/rRNA methyltransferase
MIISFVLVEPKVAENIGASARAIKTMGFADLVMVKPVNWLDGKARWVAHGSADILENARIFNSLSDAISGSDFTVATSARQRTVKQNYVPAGELKEFLLGKTSSATKVSLVFGREESGLSKEEMRLCDITSTIAMAKSYPSLNLSQAVMLFAYELADLHQTSQEVSNTKNESFRNLKRKTESLLHSLGINDDDNIFGRIMERLSFLGDDDINLLHSVIARIQRKLHSF